MSGDPGSIKATGQCGHCGHFASLHHGGGGGTSGGSSCNAPDCDCKKFGGRDAARNPLDHDHLTAAEVAQLIEVSVHTLSYWRQSGQGPKSIKAGRRTLYRRADVEHWLAEVDGRAPMPAPPCDWYRLAIAANQIDPRHTAPWKLATTYALISIAEALLAMRGGITTVTPTSSSSPTHPDSDLLTIDEVAAMTRTPRSTLRYWRHTGTTGPPSFKLGRRVLHRRNDVDAWLQSAQRRV